MQNESVDDESKTDHNDDKIIFFNKKRFGKNAIETQYVLHENKQYRNKYSQNHAYQKYLKPDSIQTWICSYKKCKGQIQTKCDEIHQYNTSHIADCDKNCKQVKLRKEQALQRMKQAVKNGSTPRDAYNAEVLNNIDIAIDFWGYREVSKTLYDVRRDDGVPLLPESKKDIFATLINSKLELDFYGKDKIYFGCDDDATFHMFTHKEALKILKASGYLLVDGTFKITPKISNKAKPQIPNDQVWIISALFKPDNPIKWTMVALPCVYVLMPGRKASTEVYSKVLKFLFKRSKDVGVDISKCEWDIMADYEIAERKALEQNIKNCVVHGCGFHYPQAVMKNISEKGLIKPYRDNKDFRHYIRKFQMLMLLPSTEVQTAFNKLKAMAPELVPDGYESNWEDWINYYETTWIDGRYNIDAWNRFGVDLRSNNLAEIVNAQLVESLGKHPPLTQWITGIQKQLALTIVRWNQLNKYGKTNWKGNNERKKTIALQELADEYTQNNLDTMKYLELCSKAMKFYFNSVQTQLDIDLEQLIDDIVNE